MKKASYLFLGLIVFLLLSSLSPVAPHKFLLVTSSSMAPTIKQGSVVLIWRTNDYGKNDIVTFVEADHLQRKTTHRIGDVIDGSYITKGDANLASDFKRISKDQIVGEVIMIISYVGYILNFIRSPLGFILILSIFAICIFCTKRRT